MHTYYTRHCNWSLSIKMVAIYSGEVKNPKNKRFNLMVDTHSPGILSLLFSLILILLSYLYTFV